jgi:citrate lyase subunit beta/citryl-CoA lyase
VPRPDNGGDRLELDYARKMFALTCHSFGIISIDTPFVNFKNMEGLSEELKYLKAIGIKAKLAIHPTQIDKINEAFVPSKEEVEYY